jgi:hypothetical protein
MGKRRGSLEKNKKHSSKHKRYRSYSSTSSSSDGLSIGHNRHQSAKHKKHNSNKHRNERSPSATPPLAYCASNSGAIQHNNGGSNSATTLPCVSSNSNLVWQNNLPANFNAVPEIDPADDAQSVEWWIHKVNECAKIYCWDDRQTCHFAL